MKDPYIEAKLARGEEITEHDHRRLRHSYRGDSRWCRYCLEWKKPHLHSTPATLPSLPLLPAMAMTAPENKSLSDIITAHGTRLYRNIANIEADVAIVASHIEPSLITGIDAADEKSVALLQATLPKLQQLHSKMQQLLNKVQASSSTSPAAAQSQM